MRLSLYVHIPFCRYKCAYCDFVSYPLIDRDIWDIYVEKVVEEIRWWHQVFPDATLYTAYIGGGTPSILSWSSLHMLSDAIRQWNEPVEFTLEANPEDISKDFVSFLADIGVNRISVGVQTFSDVLLRAWNRGHTAEDSIMALDVLNKMDVNFNADMIYPTYIPDNVSYDFKKDIDRLLKVSPNHISVYMLDVHEHTMAYLKIHSGQWYEIQEDVLYEDMAWLYDTLKGYGYHHYEISNFALPGYESKHNIVYWQQDFYIGVGVSAWGFVNFVRYENLPTIKEYLNGKVLRNYTLVRGNDLLAEYGLMALRQLHRGIHRDKWERLGGQWHMLVESADGMCIGVEQDRVYIKDDVDCVLRSNILIEELLEPWL